MSRWGTGPAVITLIAGCVLSATAGPARALPPVREQALDNGLRVFIVESHEVPLVSFRLLVPVGSARDGVGAEGIANLAGRLLLKGAGGRSAEQIAESIEELGGRLAVETERDFTTVQGQFMAKDIERALEILGRVVLQPTFAPEEIAREQELLAAEIAGEKEDPRGLAGREFMRVLLGEHPYAHPVAGSEASVRALTGERIAAFHRRYYVPAGALLAVAGDVEPDAALALVGRMFGGWRGPDPATQAQAAPAVPALAARALPARRVYVIDKPDATQSQIRIGNIAAGRDTPEYFPLIVTNALLGEGFTSRLMEEIRVNRGLSYGARSYLNFLKHGGTFGVGTFTDNRTLRETIDVALAQLERIRTEAISDQELANWKTNVAGLFPFEIETGDDLARWITTLTFYGVPLSFLSDYTASVRAVAPAECQAAAQRHFWAEGNLILLITNYQETKEQLAGLGEIQVVPLDQIQ